MRWHLFALVWGEPFVRRFAECAVPYLAAPGNVPALAGDGQVTFHIYSDDASRSMLMAGLAPLAGLCTIEIHPLDAAWAQGLRGTDFKYELQRGCLRDLTGRVADGDAVVLLDSNFIVADGTFAALQRRWHEGYRAVAVSVLRVATETFVVPAADWSARALLAQSLKALHPMTKRFFVDAQPFAAYPSQMSWRASADAFVNRNVLPHPLMVRASPALGQAQSTMDYELALRSATDDEIYMCADAVEMLVVKFSDSRHAADAVVEHMPTVEELGLFLLTETNHRHRLFADTAVVFRLGETGAVIESLCSSSQSYFNEAYNWIDRVAVQPAPLDPRRMVYLKSHFGPIEDFISPQLEGATLAHFA